MRVLVTGATGFVGREVVRELLERGHEVRALVRRRAARKLRDGKRVEVFVGDCLAPGTVTPAVAGCDAVIHLVGIIREFPGRGVTFERVHVQATKNLVDAASAAGVRRFLHMSALGARPAPADPYHVTNFQADEYVRASGLTYTIFRPSIIYGPRDRSINLFVRQIQRLGFLTIIGDGQYQLQPVPVGTVARAFALALELPGTENRVYDVGGPEPLTFDAIIDTIAEGTGPAGEKVPPAGVVHARCRQPVRPLPLVSPDAGSAPHAPRRQHLRPREFLPGLRAHPHFFFRGPGFLSSWKKEVRFRAGGGAENPP